MTTATVTVADIEQLEHEFDRTLDALRRGVDEVTDGFEQLVERVNGTLQKIAIASLAAALYVRHRVAEILERMRTMLSELVAKCQEVLREATPVYSLIRAGFAWVSDVAGPVSGKVGVVEADAHVDLANWRGPAHDAYRRKLVQQKAAVAATAASAEAVGTWLVDLATKNVELVLAMVDPLVPIAAKLVEAAIEAGSVFGALEAIGSAAEAVGKLIELLWAEVKVIVEDATNLISTVHTASRIVHDNAAFPDGAWPQAVVG